MRMGIANAERIGGPIFALDLGQRAGFAVGRPGETPRSGAVVLKDKLEPRRIALGNFIEFLQSQFAAERPELVVKEAPLTLEAFRRIHSNEENVRMHHGLHAIVEAMCVRFGIELEEAAPATIRKHFIGAANMGERSATKRAVVQRCHMLGLMPRAVLDEDRADALAVHDWACAVYGRRSFRQHELHMFGEVAGGGR